MIGAIIGDIVGFVYEWNNNKSKGFPLFDEKCFFTDDTVMTIAVADALLKGGVTCLNEMEAWCRHVSAIPQECIGITRFSRAPMLEEIKGAGVRMVRGEYFMRQP